ncbi:MAG: ribonuclease T2 family protein [Pararhizobium sp.]
MQAVPSAAAEAKPAAAAGQFDFYVLALSWSPSYCAAAGKRANKLQCGPGHHYGFIVHGLWPQAASGRLESCASSEPQRVPAELGRTLYDIMPGMSLIGHEWRAHGTCSGLSQTAYFDLVRKARQRVAVPDTFKRTPPATMAPANVEAAFVAANPGMPKDGIAVACSHDRLQEVRICLTRSLDFTSCGRVEAASCTQPSVSLPAMR